VSSHTGQVLSEFKTRTARDRNLSGLPRNQDPLQSDKTGQVFFEFQTRTARDRNLSGGPGFQPEESGGPAPSIRF
jgi:hypothetical protein